EGTLCRRRDRAASGGARTPARPTAASRHADAAGVDGGRRLAPVRGWHCLHVLTNAGVSGRSDLVDARLRRGGCGKRYCQRDRDTPHTGGYVLQPPRLTGLAKLPVLASAMRPVPAGMRPVPAGPGLLRRQTQPRAAVGRGGPPVVGLG